MGFDIYIVHAPADSAIAIMVRGELSAEGIHCLEDQGIRNGQEQEAVALEAIDKSQMVVLIYSSNINSSKSVKKLLRHAFETKKPVIQVCVENVEPTASLKELLKPVRRVVVMKLYQGRDTAFETRGRRQGIGGGSESAPSKPPVPPPWFEDLSIPLSAVGTLVREEALELEMEARRSRESRMMAEVTARRTPEKLPAKKTGGFLSRLFNRKSRQPVDRVDCSVFAPSRVVRAESFLVQVFAHCPDQAEAARKLAKEFDRSAGRRGKKTLEAEIQRGTKLTFHLVMPGLEVIDPLQDLTWWGSAESVQFEVTVPKEFKNTNIISTVTVCSENVPIGNIKFKLSVSISKAQPAEPLKLAGEAARAYRKAFISYASQDRTEVLKRVQMLSRLNIEYFQDVLSLEPGARWEKELYRHIDESDLFLLFWSSAAKQSKWVLEEVRYAINRKGGDDLSPPEILPVIIEGPPPVQPPEELAHLHFNDYIVYFLAE